MKHKLVILLCVILMSAIGIMGGSTVAKASMDYTSTDLTLTYVDDIDVYHDYIINNLAIDNASYYNPDGVNIYKITLEHDGFLKLLLSARYVTKTVIKYGQQSFATTSDATVTATVYRDSKLLYPVAPEVAAKGLTKGESKQKIALDQGTYYIAVQTDKYTNSASGSNSTVTQVKGNAEFVVYYQEVNDDEFYRPSNIGKENLVAIDDEFNGLITVTNPKDYYKFVLNDKALVKVNFMYGSTNNAKFTLYSPEREVLLTKTFSGSSVWYNIEKYLEPGTYYCSLEPVTPNDGGKISLLITQTVYPLKLTQRNSTLNSYITVSTIEEPKQIRYVKGKLTNSELTSSKWNSGKVITDALKFGVNTTGYYTVRVTDEYGNMFMQSINVVTCDTTPPGKPTIKSYKAGTDIISGTAEKNSTVIITVNNYTYSCTASSKGNFRCELPYTLIKGNKVAATAQDISGNSSLKAMVTVK